MVALLLMKQVKVMMTNHLYTFDRQLYRQDSGGPTGLQLTGEAARSVMRLFDREYKNQLVKLHMKPILHKRYVDDNNLAARQVPSNLDVRRGEGGLEMFNVEEGIELEENLEKHMAKIFRKVADEIRPKSIKMQ